jgi:hypothetical protein
LSSIDYKNVSGDEIGSVSSEKDSSSFEALGSHRKRPSGPRPGVFPDSHTAGEIEEGLHLVDS